MTRRELIMNLRAGALVWEFRRQLVDIEQAKPPSQGFIWFPGMAMPGRIPQKCSEHLTGKKTPPSEGTAKSNRDETRFGQGCSTFL